MLSNRLSLHQGGDLHPPERSVHPVATSNSARSNTLALLKAYRYAGDIGAREQLASNYAPLVRSLCKRFQPAREPQEDLFQIGMVGLLNAIERFDAERGTSLSTLAIPEILGAILNHLRDHGCLLKVPRTLRRNRLTMYRKAETLSLSLGRWPSATELADACGLSEEEADAAEQLGRAGNLLSLDESIESGYDVEGVALSERIGCEDAEFDQSLDRLTLAAALDTLPSRERTILTLRFYGEKSQRQVAKVVGMSQMHVSRLERGALEKLRLALKSESPDWDVPDRGTLSRSISLAAAS